MKDLKSEYEQITVNNVPDLWDRIEAGVDAIEEQKKTEQMKKVSADKARKKATIYRYIPIVASAAVVLFGIGIFLLAGAGLTRVVLPRVEKGDSAAESASSAGASYNEAASDSEAEYSYSDAEACEEAAPMEEAYEANEDEPSGVMNAEPESAVAAQDSYEDSSETEGNIENETGYEYTGVLTAGKDSRFVEAQLFDGHTFLLYVPEELTEQIARATSAGEEVTVTYVMLEESVIATFPEEYKDVFLGITEVKNEE